jgi:hypothetical protein
MATFAMLQEWRKRPTLSPVEGPGERCPPELYERSILVSDPGVEVPARAVVIASLLVDGAGLRYFGQWPGPVPLR